MTLMLAVCSLLSVNYVSTANIRVDPLVLISQGLVKGQKSSDGYYSEFLGIPYARVNASNPFGESIEHEGFGDSVFYANDGSVQCPQVSGTHSTEGVLDCLTLNIYVPESANTYNPMPVLIWIHGGSFESESASMYDPKYLVRHDLVVVAINYRLGPYGFFCLDSPFIPGNQGLKDQLTALRWIKSNIASFGGNPYNVTLAGHGAGSLSVEFQLYSSAEKLFHKVILQSGVAQTIGLYIGDGDTEAPIKIAAYLGLNTTSIDTALEYLTSSSTTLVTAATRDLGLVLFPCKEKSFSGVTNFITTDPVSMSNPTKLSGIPILIGNTNREGQGSPISDNAFYDSLKDNFNLSEDNVVAETDIIRHFYIGDEQIGDSVTAVEDFMSDFTFVHPSTRAVTKFLGEGVGSVYQYSFNYDKGTGKGATHYAELEYLFEMASTNTCCSTSADKTEEEILIRDRMTTLWANFVKSGNPTPTTSDLIPITWEAVSGDERPYLVIDSNLTIEHRIFHERMSLWDMFYYVYGDQSIYIKKCSL